MKLIKSLPVLFSLWVASYSLGESSTKVTQFLGSPRRMKLTFVKVSPGQQSLIFGKTSYSFELVHDNGITMDLYCRGVGMETFKQGGLEKDFPGQRSFLTYKNIANIEVENFDFSDHRLCDRVGKYLQAVFEFIDNEHPLVIEIDIPRKSITHVILPNVDPYIDRVPQEAPQDHAPSYGGVPQTAGVMH